MAKILAVIATYVPEGQIERYCPARSSKDPSYFEYFNENKFHTIKFNLACHEHYKAGLDYDLIIVDNSSPDKEWREYMEGLDIKHYTRENVGFSFGAHKWAWEKFPDYDYYLFMEQDCVPTKDDWLKDVVDLFESEPNVGAAGNYIEQHNPKAPYLEGMEKYFNLDRDAIYNLDGFYSFTSRKVLEDAGLTVAPYTPGSDIQDIWNELGFQLNMLDKGYKLKQFFGDWKIYHGVSVYDCGDHVENLPLSPLTLAHVKRYSEKDHFSWYEG